MPSFRSGTTSARLTLSQEENIYRTYHRLFAFQGSDECIGVEAGDEKSVLACFEEGLRGGFGAVVAEIARLSMTASRRLQLAAVV